MVAAGGYRVQGTERATEAPSSTQPLGGFIYDQGVRSDAPPAGRNGLRGPAPETPYWTPLVTGDRGHAPEWKIPL